MNCTLHLNGTETALGVDGKDMLLNVLRDEVGLTSVRGTCGIGLCGTCTVIVDGQTTASCILPVGLADGKEVTTIEGVPSDDPVKVAFEKANAFQCGYCTPGMILTARAFLDENPDPTDDEIAEALAGNICRCGCYVKIADAVRLAAGMLRDEKVAA